MKMLDHPSPLVYRPSMSSCMKMCYKCYQDPFLTLSFFHDLYSTRFVEQLFVEFLEWRSSVCLVLF